MEKSLLDTIVSDYTSIVRYTAMEGAAAQRETICKAIYDPLDAAYRKQPGYLDEVNLGLGCGLPFTYADIQKGMHVLDIGCGAGIDSFIAGAMTGPEGSVTGVDVTLHMLKVAAYYASKKKIEHVKFIHANMNKLPFEDAMFDRVISNCVLNLAPDPEVVFTAIHKVLKTGGKFCFSDITCDGTFSASVEQNISYYTGCLNGISTRDKYISLLQQAGFSDIKIVEERPLPIPKDIIEASPDPVEYEELQEGKRCLHISTILAVKK